MYVAIGTLVDEKYEILSISGSGGMGVVYEAHQRGLDRIVALKLLTSLPEEAREEVARFEREALVLSRMLHINIVQFYSFGSWLDMPYIAMEKLSGNSLQSLLVNNEALPLSQAIMIMRQICNGLEHAHAHGIFHRDIKPSNVILIDGNTGTGIAKIIDFGLAKLIGTEQQLTTEGLAVGSVLYMSPEQCRGEQIDARSDVYNTGCLLYHCVTGVPPFSGSNSFAVMFEHIHEPVSGAARWDTLSRPLQQVFDKCLAKDAQNRYPSVKALEYDLEQLIATEAPDIEYNAPDSEEHKPGAQVTGKDTPNRGRKTNSTFLGLAITIAVIAVTTAVVLTFGHTSNSSVNDAASLRTPYETLSYWDVRGDGDLDDQQLQELSTALEACQNGPHVDKGVLLSGYLRVVGCYHKRGCALKALGHQDESVAAFNKVITVAQKALGLNSHPAPAHVAPYMRLVHLYYEGSARIGQNGPAVTLIEETLKRYPGSNPDMNEQRMILKFGLIGWYLAKERFPEAKMLIDDVIRYRAATNSQYFDQVKEYALKYEEQYKKSRSEAHR